MLAIEKLKDPRTVFLTVAAIAAIVIALLGSTVVSTGQPSTSNNGEPAAFAQLTEGGDDPSKLPFAELVLPGAAQSIVMLVQFNGPNGVDVVEGVVSQSPAPARIGGPPLVEIEALDGTGALVESYQDWHPLWTGDYGEGDEEEEGHSHGLTVEETGVGRFIVGFSPDIETIKVTDIVEEPVELIEFDVRPTIVGYCVANPDDPGCETVCVGDVDRDGSLTVRDLIAVARAMSSTPDDPRWNPDADINQDGRVDAVDLMLVLTADCG